MTRWIVGNSLQYRLLVVAIATVVMVIGITQVRNAPVDVLPEFDAPQGQNQPPRERSRSQSKFSVSISALRLSTFAPLRFFLSI